MTTYWIAEVDITCLTTDAIVYVTNTGLILGGGAGSEIFRRGGMQIQNECRRLGKQQHGNVVVTSGGTLHIKYILHAVAMGYSHPDIEGLLLDTTTKCLNKADEMNLSSIASATSALSCLAIPSASLMKYPISS